MVLQGSTNGVGTQSILPCIQELRPTKVWIMLCQKPGHTLSRHSHMRALNCQCRARTAELLASDRLAILWATPLRPWKRRFAAEGGRPRPSHASSWKPALGDRNCIRASPPHARREGCSRLELERHMVHIINDALLNNAWQG